MHHVSLCIFRRRQQSQKDDDITTNIAMTPVHQPREYRNNRDVSQFPTSAVVTEPVKHDAVSNEEYLDMNGARLKNKTPRHPCPAANGKPGMNPTEIPSSKAQTQTGISSSSSSGLYANIRKLSARLGRGKLRKPGTETRVYENVPRGSVYINV